MLHPPGVRGSLSAPPPRFLLVDVDAMFCAVAAQADPDGAGATDLLIVGGGAGDRGVVCSCSYAARRRGVHAGMPLPRARRLVPEALVVPVPKREVGEAAQALLDTLNRWTPVVVPASVDEAYLDLTGCEPLWGDDLAATAFRIRLDVLARTGLPVSIGGGETPWLAKVAASLAKPHRGGTGLHIIPPGPEAAAEAVAGLALDDLPGIGRQLGRRLAALGLRTVADARAVPPAHLRQWLGDRDGPAVLGWIWGQDASPLRARTETPQVGRESTFAADLRTRREMASRLRALGSAAAYAARRQGIAVTTVTVVMRTTDFATLQRSHTPGGIVWDDDAVHREVLRLLERLRETTQLPVRLLGVRLKGHWLATVEPDGGTAGGATPRVGAEQGVGVGGDTDEGARAGPCAEADGADVWPPEDLTAAEEGGQATAGPEADEDSAAPAARGRRGARPTSRRAFPATRPTPAPPPPLPPAPVEGKGANLAAAMDRIRQLYGPDSLSWGSGSA